MTTNVAALRKEHDAAVASGIKFSGAQAEAYKIALTQAKGLDAQATKTKVLSEVQSRFAGQSRTFATTTAGEFARLRENISQFEAGVGRNLLPSLNQGFEGLSHWVDELRASDSVHRAAASGVHFLADGFRTIRSVVEFLIPPLEGVAHAVEGVSKFAGVGGILAFAAGFKTVAAVVSVAQGVQERYQAVIAAGQGTQNAVVAGIGREAAARNILTGAVERNTIAADANLAVATQSARVLAVDAAAGASQAAVAFEQLAAGAGAGAAAVGDATSQIQTGVEGASQSFLASSADAAVLGDSVATAGTRLAETGVKAASLGGRLSVLSRGIFAMVGGWTTVAAVGLGAVGFGIFKLVTQENQAERANHRLLSSLEELDGGLIRSAGLARSLGDAVSSIKSDKVAVEVARANLALAQQALFTTTATRGSAEYAAQVAQVASAQDALRTSTRVLAQDEGRAAAARAGISNQNVKNATLLDEATRRTVALASAEAAAAKTSAQHGEDFDAAIRRIGHGYTNQAVAQAAAIAGAGDFAKALDKDAEKLRQNHPLVAAQVDVLSGFVRAIGKIPSQRQIRLVLEAGKAQEGVSRLVDELERGRPSAINFAEALRAESTQITAGNPRLAKRLELLADFATKVGRIPTAHETQIALKTPNFQVALDALAGTLAQMDARAAQVGFKSGKAFADEFKKGELAGGDFIGTLFRSVAKVVKDAAAGAGDAAKDVSKAQLDAAKATEKAADNSVKALNARVRDASNAVADAGRQVSSAQRDLADAIRSGAQQIHDAVAQADQNLFSIGSSLSDSIDQFLDAANKTDQALSGPKEKEFQRLRKEILAGGGGPDAVREAQKLAAELQNQQSISGEDRKKKTRRQIQDLIDEFNKGAITLAQFNRRLAKILASDGISYKAAGKVLGIAFADGFRAQLEGLQKQAAAIAAGPHFKGITGLEPQIVRPLDAIKQSQREIADAQRRRDDALLSETKAEKHLNALEEQHARLILAQARAQTRAQKLMEQHLRALLAETRKQTPLLNKPPPSRRPDDRGGRRGPGGQATATTAADHGFGG